MTNYYENKPQYLSNGVVLCQPGLFCTESTYDPMWSTLKSITDMTTISLNDEVLSTESIKSPTIKAA